MASTTAKNQNDVDAMSKKDRLWDSLEFAYGQQKEASNQAFDKAISQQDRQAMGRGMQRSSYNNQTLANMRNEQVKAANDIESAKIADYETRLQQIEKDEQEQANWEASFNENKRQFNENLGFQKSEAERSQQNFEKEFGYKQQQDALAQQNWEKEFAAAEERWKAEFDYNSKSDAEKMAYNYVTTILANGGDPSDELLAQAGLSRADANAMKKQVTASGGGGNYTKKATTPTTTPQTTDAGLQAGLSSSNSTTGGMPLNPNLPTIVKNIESEQAKTNPTKLNAAKASVGEATTTTKSTSDLAKTLKNTKVPTKSQLLTNSLKKK